MKVVVLPETASAPRAREQKEGVGIITAQKLKEAPGEWKLSFEKEALLILCWCL